MFLSLSPLLSSRLEDRESRLRGRKQPPRSGIKGRGENDRHDKSEVGPPRKIPMAFNSLPLGTF